jgi:DNA-binding transcriptional regulator GbsR (MarR family)
MSNPPHMDLTTARREFVDLWGQMAEHWGINRTMAQIHALLMISPAPITADQIMEELQISRGNVSMNLRDLINWGIVRRTSTAGDRRDFFVTEADIWTMFHEIFRERKKRELDPLLSRLDACLEHAGKKPEKSEEKESHEVFVKRVNELRDFFQTFHRLFTTLLGNQPASLAKAVKMLEKVV